LSLLSRRQCLAPTQIGLSPPQQDEAAAGKSPARKSALRRDVRQLAPPDASELREAFEALTVAVSLRVSLIPLSEPSRLRAPGSLPTFHPRGLAES
jgi:hypothetical protein